MSENARPKDETASGGRASSEDEALSRRRDVLFQPDDNDAIVLDPIDFEMIGEVEKVTKWWDDVESETSESEQNLNEVASESSDPVAEYGDAPPPSDDHRERETSLPEIPSHHREAERSVEIPHLIEGEDEILHEAESIQVESSEPHLMVETPENESSIQASSDRAAAESSFSEESQPTSLSKPATTTWEDSLENEAFLLPDWADEVAEALPEIELIGSLKMVDTEFSTPPAVEEMSLSIPPKKTTPPPLPVPNEHKTVTAEKGKDLDSEEISQLIPPDSLQPASAPDLDPSVPQWEDSFQIQAPLIPPDESEENASISFSRCESALEQLNGVEGASESVPPWGNAETLEEQDSSADLAGTQVAASSFPPALPKSPVEPLSSSDESSSGSEFSFQQDKVDLKVAEQDSELADESAEVESFSTSTLADTSLELELKTSSPEEIGDMLPSSIPEVLKSAESISEEETAPARQSPAHLRIASQAPEIAKRHRPGCLSAFAISYLFASLLVLLLLAGVATYSWFERHVLSEKLSKTIIEEWEIAGVRIVSGSSRYDFAQGAVFDEISLYSGPAESDLLAKITRVSAAIDPVELVSAKPRLKARELTLRNSSITLYDQGKSLAVIQGVDARIHCDTNRIGIDRLSGVVGNLRIRIDGTYDFAPESVSGAEGASTGVAPSWSFLAPLLPWLQVDAEGLRQPTLSLSFSRKSGATSSLSVTGNLEGYGDLRWRGVGLKSISISGEWDSSSGVLRIPHAQAACGGGIVSAVLGVDWKKRILGIERLESSVDIAQVLPAYNSDWGRYFSHLRFVDAPLLRIAGTMPLDDPKNATLELVYTHRGGMEVLSGDRKLPLEDMRGRFIFHNQGVLETKDFAASLYGGQMQIAASINLIQKEMPFVGFLKVASIPAESMTPWMGKVGTGLTGGLNLTYKGKGSLKMGLSHLTGSGNLLIENATIAKLPIFAPVRNLTGRLVPTLLGEVLGTVDASYQIESGVLITSDLTLHSGKLRIQTAGNIPLETQEVVFTAKVGCEPTIGAMIGLKDQAIYVDGKGYPDAPSLTLSHFPIDFARVDLGGILGTTSETLAGLKELLPTEGASSVIAAPEVGSKVHIFASVMEILKENSEAENPQPALRAVPNE